MNLIRTCIERPIAVVAAMIMVVLFGLVALQNIPIQLTPDVNRPVISVTTIWPGAAPAEIEREITNLQEDKLRGLESLEEMTSISETGRARITLEFQVGTNMDRALLQVSNRLDQVTGYPNEADEPTIDTSGSDDQPIAWFRIYHAEGNNRPIHEYGDFMDDIVKERMERVPGVAKVNVFGGSERRMEVIVEAELMARFGLTVSEVLATLRAANASFSAGDVEEGKRRYVVRTEGELDSLESIREVVLRSSQDESSGRFGRVIVGDIATVRYGYTEPTARIRINGEPALAMNAIRETGANVIATMEGIREAAAELNAFALPNEGLNLAQVYDETVYITSSVDLVQQNIWIGGLLAATVLIVFLRSFRATLVISIAIPVSVIGAFVAMAALGRSINVISLAGLAFAIGMVVDAAIVVLENIYRLREQGLSRREAAYRGAAEVWGAVFVSALTTVMVFIPILIMELEVGQLFRDIAVAISTAVMLSLVVSITVIPALSSRLLGEPGRNEGAEAAKRVRLPVIDGFARAFVAAAMGWSRFVVRRKMIGLAVVLVVTGTAAAGTYLFLPKLEYLPEGNKNLVFGFIVLPPGYNLDTTSEVADGIAARLNDNFAFVTGPERVEGGPPKIQRTFFVAFRGRTLTGVISQEPESANELVPVLEEALQGEPGSFSFANQASIFSRDISGSRRVDLDILGRDLEAIVPVAQEVFFRILQAFPESERSSVIPVPGLELGVPEIRVFPDRLKLADNDVSARELGETIDVFNDGLRVAEVTESTQQIDLVLKGPEEGRGQTQDIGQIPVVTGEGRILPASSLSDIRLEAGPVSIRHRSQLRAITIELTPTVDLPLEAAVEKLREEVIEPMQEAGLPPGIQLGISGTADKLAQTWDAMVWDLLLALVIVYLVMAVLFESFVYPMIIMLAVPIAGAGGVAGLAALNLYVQQPLDMLTLLGFVILVGIVVNNAILLVHQTLHHIRAEGMTPNDAILEATRNRIRPIFMSTLTSVFGMMPLVLFPGAGSELYRGLGSVVVGGLSMSAVLTLLLIPPMLALTAGVMERAKTSQPADGGRPMPVPGE